MRIPIVIPTLEKLYGNGLIGHFNKYFSEMNIEEVFNQVQKDAKEKGIEITFSSNSLYAPFKALNFIFKKRPRGHQSDPNKPPKAPKVLKPVGEKGKRGKKESPVFNKFLQDLGGLEKTKTYLGELVTEGISIKEAVERINEKTKGNYSYGNISYFAKKLHMDFEKSKRKGNPNLGKNRPSPILDEFLSNFKDEEEAKTYLFSLNNLSLNDAREEINGKIKKEISYSNLLYFAKKYEIEFKRLKAKKGEGKHSKPITGEIEMVSENETISKTPIKIHYKCKECGEAKATRTFSLLTPLGLKGMKCHHCGEWGTYTATVISETGTRRFSVVETEGINKTIKINIEEEIDENLNPIQSKTIAQIEFQPA